jgi:hypothetical protein
MSIREVDLSVTTLPENIKFVDQIPVEPKLGWCWSIALYPLQVIGTILRNALFLPLYSEKTRLANKLELDLAK